MPDNANILVFPARPQPSGRGLATPPSPLALAPEPLIEISQDGLLARIGEDGSVEISAPAVHTHRDQDEQFGANLAEALPEGALDTLADDLNQGVEADERSRAELIANYDQGVDLLGLKIEEVSEARGSRSGQSRIGDSLLLEAIIKYHAGFVGEMLPAEGPVKVMTVGAVTADEEQRAQDFESDFNYYVTEVAREYYPDTSRMGIHQGYCGTGYKKIFRCAMRQRPVSESINMPDLIVSEEATDLDNAQRVTHRLRLSRAAVRRMQIAGAWRDIDLGWPSGWGGLGDSAHRKIQSSQGLAVMASRPQDTPFLILETDSDLDAGLYDLDFAFERAAPWGMPLPYKIAFDGQTRRVLGIWRNWKPNDPLYRKNNRYVKFGMVPGLGFHDWGFLQLLGNSTKALRAVTRLLLDGGLYSNFPGGVKLKGTRTGSNEIQPAPGEFVDIDAAGVDDIRKVIMGMPYKSIEPVFIQFAEIVRERAQRLGGTVEIETGEGRTNMPVGTIMSMIEQQTQVMAAVHKSNHRAQREELHKLRELFADNPKDLWRLARDPKRRWEVADEFMDLNLVPASDPNIPAQVHRIMQAWALGQIVMMNPQLYDVREVNRRILQAIRIASPETLLLSPQQLAMQAQQSAVAGAKPNDPARMAQVQQKAQSDELKTQLEIAKLGAEAQSEAREQQLQAAGEMAENTQRAADRVSQQQIAGAKEETQRLKLATEFAKHGIGGSGALGNGAAMGMGAPEPMASAEEAAP